VPEYTVPVESVSLEPPAMLGPAASLSVHSASVSYGTGATRIRALADVSLSFPAGELTLVTGASGSGKTTLLAVLGCLQRPDEGTVFVNGIDAGSLSENERTTLRRRNIGFIFQAFRLFHSLSALENVMLAADIAGRRNREWRQRALDLLTVFGLADRLHLKPDALSGGEKQRVAIARALLPGPLIVLADEPTASLDSKSGEKISDILVRISSEFRHIVVVVSHDPRWTELATSTVTLRDGYVTDSKRSHP
jgi:ABC-type lipoprotein export system ATPase subunit